MTEVFQDSFAFIFIDNISSHASQVPVPSATIWESQTLSQHENTKLEGTAYTLEGRAAINRDMEKLENGLPEISQS